jgi:hypothetical protein
VLIWTRSVPIPYPTSRGTSPPVKNGSSYTDGVPRICRGEISEIPMRLQGGATKAAATHDNPS